MRAVALGRNLRALTEPPGPFLPESRMIDFPHLENAPIQEALIDIRAVLPDTFDVESLREVADRVEGFPTMQQSQRLEARLDLEASALSTERADNGYFFRSEDSLRVAQLRTDGFTFNWLRPYRNWEELFAQARVFWDEYLAIAEPEQVTRIAVRYINRFPVDLPTDLGEVVRIPGQWLPPGFEGPVSDFLYRITFREEESALRCNLTLTGERNPPGGADVILDIDCFEVRMLSPTDPQIWERVLPDLRHLKNRVFFSTLTESRVEAFK